MGNVYCQRFSSFWAEVASSTKSSRKRDSFGATASDNPVSSDKKPLPLPTMTGFAGGPWVDPSCPLHCSTCLEQLHLDPLTLACACLRGIVAESSQAVPRFTDAAVYVAMISVMTALGGVISLKAGILERFEKQREEEEHLLNQAIPTIGVMSETFTELSQHAERFIASISIGGHSRAGTKESVDKSSGRASRGTKSELQPSHSGNSEPKYSSGGASRAAKSELQPSHSGNSRTASPGPSSSFSSGRGSNDANGHKLDFHGRPVGLHAPQYKEALPCVAPIYSDVLQLLEEAWRRTSDSKSCRPFLRLGCGWLLHLKFMVELCFTEGFAPAHHGSRLSELAIKFFSALQTHDAEVLWSSLQTLDSPEERESLIGHNQRAQSHAACCILRLQGYAALLVHPWKPLEGNDCPVDEALSRMDDAVNAIPQNVASEVSCLVNWEVVHSADCIFRHVHGPETGRPTSPKSHEDSAENRAAAEQMQTWAVRNVAEVAIWRGGDDYAAIVAVFAVRTLILWHGLLLQKDDALRKSSPDVERGPLLMKVERILARVSAHCAGASNIDGDAKEEARAVAMLLNDHSLAGAPMMNAQQHCLLHSKQSSAKDTKDVHPLAGRLAEGRGFSHSSSTVSSNGSRSGRQIASDSPTAAIQSANAEDYPLHSSEQSITAVEARPVAGESPRELEAALPADVDAAFRLLCPELELETGPAEPSTAPGTAPQEVPDDAKNHQDPGSPPLCTLIGSATGDTQESTVDKPAAENEAAAPELGLLEANGCQASHRSGGLSELAVEDPPWEITSQEAASAPGGEPPDSNPPTVTAILLVAEAGEPSMPSVATDMLLVEDLLDVRSVTTDLLITEALLEVGDVASPGQP
jgi:hypothetical protein